MATPALLSFFFGIFSMGFQLLGSRLLSPWFGSSIIVWAFIISTFLTAFSAGSILGGMAARASGRRRFVWTLSFVGLAIVGFLINAVCGRGLMGWIDEQALPLPGALTLACGVLFLPPICGLAALTPLLIQRISEAGHEAGWASGVIYSIGTLGNIVGIMLTVFLLIPNLPVSSLLWGWTVAIAAGGAMLLRWMRA
jgi:MFS family permease